MWIVAGLSMGLVFVTLAFWFRSRKAELTWYEWLLGLLGVALFFFHDAELFCFHCRTGAYSSRHVPRYFRYPGTRSPGCCSSSAMVALFQIDQTQ